MSNSDSTSPNNSNQASTTDTTNTDGASAKPRKWTFRILIGLNCLVLYILSIGPMFWMWYEAENIGTTPFLRVLYAPLRTLCYFEPLENWMNDYINWWIT